MIFAKFDLDSTLVNTDDLIELALAEQGYMLQPGAHTGWFYTFIEGYEPPPDFQWEVFFYRLLTERLDELKPVDEFVNGFLEEITPNGEPVHVITARTHGVIMHHACMSTLERCFPNVEFHVSVLKSGEDKLKYMGQCDIMFEDRRKTALQLAHAGNIVAMPNKTYNKIPNDGDNYVVDIESCGTPGNGDIVRYDSFDQVLRSQLLTLVRPF
jgi:hypothetical protein